MKKVPLSEAQKKFDEILLNIQNESVQINDNGKPLAVIMSFQEFNMNERIKLEMQISKAVLT